MAAWQTNPKAKIALLTKKFYVYVLSRPNGEPFYVGKGTGDRMKRHELHAKNGRQQHRHNIIRKIWREGGEVCKTVVFSSDIESDAFSYEADLIARLGRENLSNRSDGGEGPTGHRKSAECRARLRAVAAARTPETLAKMRHPHTAESKARMTASRLGRKLPAEHRANMSKAKLGKAFSDEHKRNLSESLKVAMNRPEIIARRSAFRHTPESKAKIADNNRRRPISDQTRAKLRAAAFKGAQMRREQRV